MSRPPLRWPTSSARRQQILGAVRSHLAWPHRKVLDAIVRCRTAALGGHRDQCVRCGHQAISYNSCRTGTAPSARERARPVARRAQHGTVARPYFHVVFTLPHELSALALQNKRLLYDLLFRASAATLLELAARSQASGGGHRVPWRAPHLGTEPSPSSAHPLRRSRRRPCTRRFPMDRLLETILPARRRAQSRVPRQVRSRTEATLSQDKLQFHGSLQILPSPRHSTRSCDSSSAKTGWSTPSHPSAVLNMF